MHSKFKVNILPNKGNNLPMIRPMLTSAGIDAKSYTLKNLERGNGIYALVSDIAVTRQILASLEASLAPAAGFFYLVDSPRLSTIVVKGVHLKTKEGEPIPMSSIVTTIHTTVQTTNSTSGVVAASRLRNKNQQPTNALSEWIGCLTSQLMIFQSYMWRHIDVQADWRRSWTYGRAPNAIDIS